tara:strand:+ start:372 stop:620 length:249 start_codon:yes stop_codon:yes gene_type:complete
MKCIICKRAINVGHSLNLWVENTRGSLVKLGNTTPAEAHLCASVYGRRNVCKEALNDGRTYLNDDEVAARCPKTAKITEVIE